RCADAGRDHQERHEIGVCADREMIAERLAYAEADARKEHGLIVAAGSRRLRVVDGPSIDELVLGYRFVEVRAIEAVAEIRVKARPRRAAQPLMQNDAVETFGPLSVSADDTRPIPRH